MDASDLPAWVQAIGSVVAILVAIALQVWSERVRARRIRSTWRVTVSRVGDEVRECIGAMKLSHEMREELKCSGVELEHALGHLQAFGLHPDLDEKRLEIALDLLKVARSVAREASSWAAVVSDRQPVGTAAIRLCEEWLVVVDKIEAGAQALGVRG